MVPRSQRWALAAPFPHAGVTNKTATKSLEANAACSFVYTPKYRHLLAVRARALASSEVEDDDELHRYGSSVQKEWMSFMDNGFAPPDQNKLRFDLTGMYFHQPPIRVN